ncbi:hypothetical protein D3C79_862520 [compost metagenome]
MRPDDAFRAKGISSAYNIDQVPAAITALPLPGIRVEEVAVQAVAGNLVVETQGVVTGAAGPREGQLRVHPRHELGFAQALAGQLLGGDTRHQAGRRVRQDIVAGAAIKTDRLVDLIELEVGAHSGHLQRPVAARVDTGGFVVVPENARGHGDVLIKGRPDSSGHGLRRKRWPG